MTSTVNGLSLTLKRSCLLYLKAWLADTQSCDQNDNNDEVEKQGVLKDFRAAVFRYRQNVDKREELA